MSGKKLGEDAYNPVKMFNRGTSEFAAGFIFPDSNIPLRDHSGLYGSSAKRDMEPSRTEPEVEREGPEVEYEEPELDQ